MRETPTSFSMGNKLAEWSTIMKKEKKSENQRRGKDKLAYTANALETTEVGEATGAYLTQSSKTLADDFKSQAKAMNWKYMGKETEPDNKHRISLGTKIQTPEGVRYRVLANEFGQILLDPVKTVPAREAWVWENEERIESIRRGIKQAEEGLVGTIDLSAYADDNDEEE